MSGITHAGPWFAAFALLLALAGPAVASACTTSHAEVDLLGAYYVDHDPCIDCYDQVWIYQESNGIPGLQRGDEVKDDTKGGTACQSDTIVW